MSIDTTVVKKVSCRPEAAPNFLLQGFNYFSRYYISLRVPRVFPSLQISHGNCISVYRSTIEGLKMNSFQNKTILILVPGREPNFLKIVEWVKWGINLRSSIPCATHHNTRSIQLMSQFVSLWSKYECNLDWRTLSVPNQSAAKLYDQRLLNPA